MRPNSANALASTLLLLANVLSAQYTFEISGITQHGSGGYYIVISSLMDPSHQYEIYTSGRDYMSISEKGSHRTIYNSSEHASLKDFLAHVGISLVPSSLSTTVKLCSAPEFSKEVRIVEDIAIVAKISALNEFMILNSFPKDNALNHVATNIYYIGSVSV